MLEKIRKAGNHFTFKIIFILIAIVFSLSLLDFSNPNSNVIANIGDHKISLSEFFEAKERAISELGITREQLQGQENFIDMNILMQLVSQSLIDQEVKSLGLKIDPAIVIDQVKKVPAFQKNGEFDLDLFKNIMAANNVSEEEMINDAAARIASRFLFDTLTVNLPLNNLFNKYVSDYLTKKAQVSIISINNSSFSISNIKDDELKNYFEQYKDSYVTKELRSFDYLLVNQDELVANLKITDEDIKREYDENKTDYMGLPTRNFFHFLAPSEKTANELIQALSKDNDIQKVAKSFVAEKVITENFTNQNSDSFFATIDPSVFQLNENEVTSPVKSDLGWHVFLITKINEPEPLTLAQAKDKIRGNLLYNAQEKTLNEFLGLIEEDVASGASFEDIATRNHVHLNKANRISLDDDMYNKSNSANNQLNKNIVELAFQLEDQEESALTMLGDNKTYVVLKLTEIIPSRLETYEEAKNEVITDYTFDKKNDITAEYAELLRKKLMEENQNLLIVKNNKFTLNSEVLNSLQSQITSKYGLKLSAFDVQLTNKELMRPEISKNEYPDYFVSQLFSLGVNNISLPQQLSENSYAIVRLNQIVASNKIDSNLQQKLAMQATESYKNEIYDLYMNYLRSKYLVEVNMAPLNEYYAD